MNDTVGDLLYLRGVRLTRAVNVVEIVGFRCLGVAEKIPELEDNTAVSYTHLTLPTNREV